MKPVYTLKPNNVNFVLDVHFPKLAPNRKMGIFLSGGMESCLISYLADKIYGKDRVLFFYSDDIFSCNNEDINTHINTNISRAANLLGITPTYLSFNYTDHVTNRKQSIEAKMESLKTDYSVDFVMFGFTKLFFEVEAFKQEGMTVQKVKEIAYANLEKYKSTIEEFHLPTDQYTDHLLDIDIPAEVYPLLRGTSSFIKSPFENLNKAEVVDFYRQLGILDILYGTSSCIHDSLTRIGKHCGQCFNCQQRWDAFKILGNVEDRTEYETDAIVHRRIKLENVIHSQNS